MALVEARPILPEAVRQKTVELVPRGGTMSR
jgi:hypothetical protein